MKMVYAGAIASGIVVIVGAVIIIPVFYQKRPISSVSQPTAILSFSVVNDNNVPTWCNDLSSVFKKYDIKAIVFVVGKIASKYPQCISAFSSSNDNNNIDIGSQTYNFLSLTSTPNYSAALEEVKNGKQAVDNAGKLDSKLFKAPYGSTDQNIYSLLSRSGIVADFSYAHQFNKYESGQFIKYDLIAYNGSNYSSKKDLLDSLSSTKLPVLVDFDNSTPIDQIDSFISNLKSEIKDIHFINASELTRMDLTIRKKV
jgi:peptidoglycan/xylan/chitin deacetylase (PgdA/CDA1 family)